MEVAGTDGDNTQVVMYNHLMTANRGNRLLSQGDFIRGDMVPCCATGKDAAWQPSAALTPTNSLLTGAINVMAGLNNETSKQLAVLNSNAINSSVSGGVNLSNQQLASIGAGGSDVSVVSFA